MEDKGISVIVVLGATSTGKSALAIELAKALDAEIISFDSMQIYRGFDIATAKPTKAEMQGIRHHLISEIDVDEKFSVARFKEMLGKAIADISDRGKRIIMVGGTGLYLKAFLNDIDFKKNSFDEKLRNRLNEAWDKGKGDELYKELCSLDKESAESIQMNDKKRIIRALEFFHLTNEKLSEQTQNNKSRSKKYGTVLIGLKYENRDLLYEKINSRVDEMIEKGLIAEAQESFKKNFGVTATQAIGHKELYPFFKGEMTLETATENLKRKTRNYAKRQLTWFNKEENVKWILADKSDLSEQTLIALKLIGDYEDEKG